jgi:hypothetical protein
VKPFDIHFASYRWRQRDYGGFLLLVRSEGEDWLCFAISSHDSSNEAFELSRLDPDFPATGLDHTSYVFDGAPFCRITPAETGNRKGELRGQLLAAFRKESGV